MTIITSKSNNLIKETKKLSKKKYRDHSYLIEGWHFLEEAEKAGAEFSNTFVLEDYADRVNHLSMVTYATPGVLRELTDSKTPQGIIAEVAMPSLPLADLKAGRYLVLEDVQGPGNVGTMIRAADIAGLDGILISEKSADIYNQKTLRSMQGSHFRLLIWRTDVYEACQKLQNLDIPLIATALSKESVGYKTVGHNDDFAPVVGNEGNGISELITKQADILAHIIMPGQVESLSVAVATGIVLFQLI